MKIYIQNMVSLRCKMLVRSELEQLGLHPVTVDLGEVEIVENIDASVLRTLRSTLRRSGLEIIDDYRAILIEKIKVIIVELIHYTDERPRTNFSDYLSEQLNHNYNYLSNLFSEVKGITIEHFIISHKIERAKALLMYDDMSVSEIAERLHYSSSAHLSNQFKRVTGLTPTFFKKMKHKRLIPFEDL